jgi:predicted nuclease of predicted toxin-antitoxin system
MGQDAGSARLRLLLDEMYPPAIAEQLRRRGHEVEAVVEREELRALPDPEVFALAQREQRALLTENIADFTAIADDYDRRGQPHHGLVLAHPRRHPRGDPRTVGRMVEALARLLEALPESTPTSLRHWL